jgi:hypothetical protein
MKVRKNNTEWVATKPSAMYVLSEKRFHLGGYNGKEPDESLYFIFSPRRERTRPGRVILMSSTTWWYKGI